MRVVSLEHQSLVRTRALCPRLPDWSVRYSVCVWVKAANETGPVALYNRDDRRIRGAVAGWSTAVDVVWAPNRIHFNRVGYTIAFCFQCWV